MVAPSSRPEPMAAAPPVIDAYEAYWQCMDEPTDATPATGDINDVGSGDAYAAYQALNDG